MKTNLPVIILKGIVLLPNNDIRLEFENDDSKNIVDISELFHDNKVLVVSQLDLLEEMPNIDELEKYGVVSKISHKMELPNGKVRVTINGLYRAEVHEYLNKNRPDDILESIISKKISEELPEKEEKAFIRKLYREMELYIKALPYVSNSVLSLVNNVTSLDKMTDIIIPYLQIDNKRTMKYLKENSALKRLEMILEDIYSEKEMFQIEKQIDTKVRKEMEENQKEYILREKIKAIKQELGDSSLKDVEIEELKNQLKGDINVVDKVEDTYECSEASQDVVIQTAYDMMKEIGIEDGSIPFRQVIESLYDKTDKGIIHNKGLINYIKKVIHNKVHNQAKFRDVIKNERKNPRKVFMTKADKNRIEDLEKKLLGWNKEVKLC